jgi:hypothetical protein
MTKSFRYVKDFEFPSEAGYTGSCGKTTTKGYARGGNVAAPKTPAPTATPANAHGKATSAAAHARNDARKAAKVAPVAAKPAAPTMSGKPAIAAKQAMMCGGKVMKKAAGGKVMKKADGGNVTTNEAGQRLFVSTPSAPTPAMAAPPPPRRTRRELRKEMRSKIGNLNRKQSDYRNQRKAIHNEYNQLMKGAPRYEEGGKVVAPAKTAKPAAPSKSNAGGATRGLARAAEVGAKAKPANKSGVAFRSNPLIPAKKMK